jgi:hypothetical protein
MSEKSQEVLLYNLVEPPEFDADEEELEKRYQKAFYESSKIDIHDQMNTEDFEATWQVLRSDIENESLNLQRIFSEQTLDKISEIYDFVFPINIDFDSQYKINDFYDFLEFLEYKNENFLASVWRFLKPHNLVRFDIEGFCKSNSMKVIREIDEQLQIHPQTEMIDLFLRTYYKEKIIEWFINRTERKKVDITVQIFEEGE